MPMAISALSPKNFRGTSRSSESGTVTVTRTGSIAGTDTLAALITVARGCIGTGTPYEGLANDTQQNANMTGPAVTTTGSNRTICHFCANDPPVQDVANQSTAASGYGSTTHS